MNRMYSFSRGGQGKKTHEEFSNSNVREKINSTAKQINGRLMDQIAVTPND